MNDKIIEYDKKIGVPEFKGWQEREYEAFLKRITKTVGYDTTRTNAKNLWSPIRTY